MGEREDRRRARSAGTSEKGAGCVQTIADAGRHSLSMGTTGNLAKRAGRLLAPQMKARGAWNVTSEDIVLALRSSTMSSMPFGKSGIGSQATKRGALCATC